MVRRSPAYDRFAESSVPRMRDVLARGEFDLLAVYAATNRTKGFDRLRKDTFCIIAVTRTRTSKQS